METSKSTIDLVNQSVKGHHFKKVRELLKRRKKDINFCFGSKERRNFDKFLIRCIIRNYSPILDEYKETLGEKYGNREVERIAQGLSILKQAEREKNSKMDYARVILHLMKADLSCEVMMLIIKDVLKIGLKHKNLKKSKNKEVYWRTLKDYRKHLESVLHHPFYISQSQ